jgi:uncharacterized protein YbjQ (UPF0145 family)
MLTATSHGPGGGSKQLAELRKKAGALGANAIILVSTEAPTTSTVSSGYVQVATVESGSYVTKAVAMYVAP